MTVRFLFGVFLFGCTVCFSTPVYSSTDIAGDEDYKILHEIITNEFKAEIPSRSGVALEGVLNQFETKDRQVSILLEACSVTGSEIDIALFQKLGEQAIPVSLFVDQAWLEKNQALLKEILAKGHVTLENHGLTCQALSVSGKGPDGRSGTKSVDDAFEEIEKNARVIESVSGRLPRFYKAGYDFYDDVALKIVNVLGYTPVKGDLRLRAKDVASNSALKNFVDRIEFGSIITIPANRPGTANDWLPKLLDGIRQKGYQVVTLENVAGVKDEEL